MANTKWLIILLAINTASAVLQAIDSTTGITPGQTGAVILRLTNTGSEIAYDTKIVLKRIDSPLIIDEVCDTCEVYSTAQGVCTRYADKCYYKIGDIYGSNAQEAVLRVTAPDNTPTGTYVIDLDIHYDSKNITTNAIEERTQTKSIAISITNDNIKPDINIKTIETPELSPGDEFNITIELENTGGLKARDLNLELISDYFQIRGSTNKKYLGEVESGETIKINYTLLTDAKLTPGVYTIGLKTDYADNDNTYSKTSETGILLDGATDFSIYIQDITPDLITRDTIITALISIANTGIINAESVIIKINQCSDIELGNVNQDFLADLNTGDFTTTSFKFTPKKEGELKINLTIEYVTPSGRKENYNTTQTIIIRYAQEQVTVAPTINPLSIALIITIIILSAYLLKKRKSKK